MGVFTVHAGQSLRNADWTTNGETNAGYDTCDTARCFARRCAGTKPSGLTTETGHPVMSRRSFRTVVLEVCLLAPGFLPVPAASETVLFYRPTRPDDPEPEIEAWRVSTLGDPGADDDTGPPDHAFSVRRYDWNGDRFEEVSNRTYGPYRESRSTIRPGP